MHINSSTRQVFVSSSPKVVVVVMEEEEDSTAETTLVPNAPPKISALDESLARASLTSGVHAPKAEAIDFPLVTFFGTKDVPVREVFCLFANIVCSVTARALYAHPKTLECADGRTRSRHPE